MQVLVEPDPVQVWLWGIDNEKTRASYAQSLKRLSDVTDLTSLQVLAEARMDMKRFWIRIKAEASPLRPHTRTMAYCAVRSYLRANGEFPSFDRIRRPPRVRLAILGQLEVHERVFAALGLIRTNLES